MSCSLNVCPCPLTPETQSKLSRVSHKLGKWVPATLSSVVAQLLDLPTPCSPTATLPAEPPHGPSCLGRSCLHCVSWVRSQLLFTTSATHNRLGHEASTDFPQGPTTSSFEPCWTYNSISARTHHGRSLGPLPHILPGNRVAILISSVNTCEEKRLHQITKSSWCYSTSGLGRT